MLYLRKMQPHLAKSTKVLGYPPLQSNSEKRQHLLRLSEGLLLKAFAKMLLTTERCIAGPYF